MKELDFDELDRAVNTLMGNVSQTAEPVKQDDVKVLTITSTLTDDTPPVMPVGEVREVPHTETAPVEQSVDVSSTPVSERSAAPAVRRSGRFMDVIHPSATARKATPSQTVSRQGVTLAPLSAAPVVQEEPAPAEEEIVPVHVDEPIQAEMYETQSWPDPLEFNQPDDDMTATEADIEIEEVVDDSFEQDAQAEPLISPFIPDAKVEKRPLGAPAPEFAEDLTELGDETEDDVTEATETVAEVDNVTLPEELQGDLMAIESGVSASRDETETTKDADEANDEKEKAVEVISAPPVIAATPALAAVATPTAAPVGPVSIPQQYREEPSTGDVTNGSIYDTASYHQPLEHPAKKKAGWLWVIWVFVLLIVGAGGGALAYLYLLQ